jgi:hypothetical protein
MWPPPDGLTAIIETFGDPRGLPNSDRPSRAWETKNLARARLAVPLRLGWRLGQTVTSFRCHVLLVRLFEKIFDTLHRDSLDETLITFDGCYHYRCRRGGGSLSTHSWGIAIDLNAATNRMGTDGDQDLRLVDVFRDHGFEWGGDWGGRRRDPMHFQYCAGY